MSIEFKINKKDNVIIIVANQDISNVDVSWMRNKTIDVLNATGINNFLVDLSETTSILEQDVLSAYQQGKAFQAINFPVTTKTAVILPVDENARKQAKFLHTVESNRYRGPIRYVSSYEEALVWFSS